MKKTLSLLLTLALVLSLLGTLSGCKAGGSSVQLKNLGKDTVVYPASWEDWQKEDVDVLVNAVEKLSGTKINAVPDTETVDTNMIIIAGSSVETSYDDKIKKLSSDMDYIIAVDKGDIVLGGKSYYADMRAIYAFVNDYLGYDDLTDTVGEAKDAVAGAETFTYEEPLFTTLACDNGKYPFRTAADVKAMADAGFNMVRLELAKIDTDLYHEYGKWCARFGIRMIQRVVYNIKTGEFTLNDLEYTKNNPVFYGNYIKYEADLGDPALYTTICEKYKQNYSDFGWKLVMEVVLRQYSASLTGTETVPQDTSYFAGADVALLTTEIGDDNDERKKKTLDSIRSFAEEARKNGSEFWITVQNTASGTDSNPKIYNWRAYVGLAFGAKGINYLTYKRSVIVKDNYEKTAGWTQAKMTNEDMLATAELYSKYEYAGAFSRFTEIGDQFAVFDETYTGFDGVADIEDTFGLNYTYIVGCFNEKDGDGHALVVTNVSQIDDMPYDSIISLPVLVRTGSENAHFYIGGKEDTDTKIPGYDDCLGAMIVNGRGGFITFD